MRNMSQWSQYPKVKDWLYPGLVIGTEYTEGSEPNVQMNKLMYLSVRRDSLGMMTRKIFNYTKESV